jgi:hypothetical protein
MCLVAQYYEVPVADVKSLPWREFLRRLAVASAAVLGGS